MKPSRTFIITCFIILGCVLISMLIQHSARKHSRDLRHKQTRFLIGEIEDIKEEFNSDPNGVVTKADLVAFAEINRYQSEIDKLYMENRIELSKGIHMIFPDYFLLILVLWLSFQLDKISKQIEKQSGKTKPIPNKNGSEKK